MSARRGPKNFFTRVETDDGPVIAHVNRRGCKGHWTKTDQAALDELVRAVHKMHRDGTLPVAPRETEDRTPSLEREG